MIFIISMHIPDTWKTKGWLLWDRRETWRVNKRYYRDFQKAYEGLRLHERIDSLIKKHREAA
ncbi:hypothetical protein ACI00O_002309 [Cronobacter sakazakii]|nr:hypothetical protein [Cronobacter sakazakii]ELY4860647.1 hypothetical protein [Cronobacter sakazakii]